MEYQSRGFLEKNRDALYEELVDAMRASKVINLNVFMTKNKYIFIMKAVPRKIVFFFSS